MSHTLRDRAALSARVCNAAMLLYIVWLMLPMVQTTGRAATGVALCGLFAAGVVLDWDYLRGHWVSLGLRAACALIVPLCLRFFMLRGGESFGGFYVQAAMLWLPVCYCGYARERGDARLIKYVKWTLLATVAITTLTTVGWLVEGMLRGGKVYAYSRSLGNAEPGREAYLKELMLRNIGGYDFVYATVVAMPFTIIGVQRRRGWARAGYAALLAAQAVMVALSQYTYAMIFAACLLTAELIGAVVRAASRGKVGMGASLLIGLAPLALAFLLREPLISLAAGFCERAGFENFAISLNQLLGAVRGAATDEATRLTYYMIPLEGIARSPIVGSMLGGEKLMSMHSDLLDLLSGMGVVGAAALGAMVWLIGRGGLRGVKQSAERAQLCASGLLLAAVAALGTVVYSRDIFVVIGMGLMLVFWDASKKCN